MGALLHAFAGQSVEDYYARTPRRSCVPSSYPTLGRSLVECGYLPMIDLLRYLDERDGFTNYIASGGDRDFMRARDERDLRHPSGTRDRQLERARVR